MSGTATVGNINNDISKTPTGEEEEDGKEENVVHTHAFPLPQKLENEEIRSHRQF